MIELKMNYENKTRFLELLEMALADGYSHTILKMISASDDGNTSSFNNFKSDLIGKIFGNLKPGTFFKIDGELYLKLYSDRYNPKNVVKCDNGTRDEFTDDIQYDKIVIVPRG